MNLQVMKCQVIKDEDKIRFSIAIRDKGWYLFAWWTKRDDTPFKYEHNFLFSVLLKRDSKGYINDTNIFS